MAGSGAVDAAAAPLVERRGPDLVAIGFAAMASPCEVLLATSDLALAREIARIAAAEALRIERKFSRYRPDSVITRLNNSAGARVEVDEGKRDPLDFVLWKRAKPGEPAWDSPWGLGRPGWHIECSAMSVALLGDHFDIHGGGMDLKFPHHENEIAQTCAACGSKFVDTWMHNGFVNVNAEKMSKSLGNFFTVREVLPHLRPEVMRAFVLSSHYRGPINYSDDNLRQADASLERLYVALRDVVPTSPVVHGAATEKFKAAMDDDFNTPEALAALQALARDLNVAKGAGDGAKAAVLAAELVCLAGVVGLLGHEPEAWLRTRPAKVLGDGTTAAAEPDAAEIDALVEARMAARKARDFKESDRIRDALLARGVLLEDGPQGTSWRYR